MKKGSAKRVSSLPSNAEFNLGGLYHALRIATVRSSDSLWVPFDKEGKCCKVIHSPTQPQYVETICCLLYTNDELISVMKSTTISPLLMQMNQLTLSAPKTRRRMKC